MHDTLNSSKFRFTARDGGSGSGGGSGLSTGTIIVIAVVCGCVFLLALTLFLWRFLVRCCGSRESAPLPPVQELAHHRWEQQRAFAESVNAANRPLTWAEPSTHSPYTGSAVSLLTNPEKNLSVYTDDMTAESTLPSPSPDDDGKLYPPNPSFYRASDASNSRNTLAESPVGSQSSLRTVASPSPSPSPSAPLSESVSSNSQLATMNRSASGPISRPQSAQSRSRVASASRGRRFSQISDSPTTGSGFTTRSRSASYYGGPPHRPGNNVQIILPAPLAPQAAYPGDAQAMYNIPQMSRSSVFADQWLTAGNSERRSIYDEAADAPRVKSRSRSRHRVTASVPNAPPNPAPSSTFRRAASQHSPASRSRSTLRKQSHDGGALPEVPPKHSHLADLAESAYEDDAARGRSRTQTRLETIPSGQIPPSSSYPFQPQLEQQ